MSNDIEHRAFWQTSRVSAFAVPKPRPYTIKESNQRLMDSIKGRADTYNNGSGFYEYNNSCIVSKIIDSVQNNSLTQDDDE